MENVFGMKGSEMVLPAGEFSKVELTVGASDCMRGDGSCSVSSPLLICEMASGLCSLNFASASSACMSSQLTHWLSEEGYPFHLTRYWTLCPQPCFLESKISSTSYSSCYVTVGTFTRRGLDSISNDTELS